MDFRFDADQLALQSAVRSFCEDRLALDAIADRENAAASTEVWQGLADLGVLGMLAEISDGIGTVEAAIVFEALGTHLAPGPVLWSVLAAGLLPEVGTGRVRVTGVEAPNGSHDIVVPHARESDVLVVLHDDRVESVPIDSIGEMRDGTLLDPLTPAARCSSMPAGVEVGDEASASLMRLRGTVLAAASLVGLAQGALDVARDYALGREQFDKPIGSFQAVKHLLADMFVRVELARSAMYAAAATVADPRAGDAYVATSSAKLLAGEAAIANSGAAVQILGGMGFTWDMLPHYYLKRAWVLENAFGQGPDHALALAAAIETETAGV